MSSEYDPTDDLEVVLSKKFKREFRYTVLKQTDIEAAIDSGSVTEQQLLDFNNFCRLVHIARVHVRGKTALDCVVVEHDWRIYEPVWALVEMEHDWNQHQRELIAELEDLEHQPPTQEEIDKFNPEIGPLYHPTGIDPDAS